MSYVVARARFGSKTEADYFLAFTKSKIDAERDPFDLVCGLNLAARFETRADAEAALAVDRKANSGWDVGYYFVTEAK